DLERVDRVEPSQRGHPDMEHSVPACHEIEAAQAGRPRLDARSGRGAGQAAGGLVLVQVARVEPGGADFRETARVRGRENRTGLGEVHASSFPELTLGDPNRGAENSAGEIAGGKRGEVGRSETS